MQQRFGQLLLATTGQGLLDVTPAVRDWVSEQPMDTGLLTVWCRHTSASLLVQADADPEVMADLEAFFARLAPEGKGLYRHADDAPDNMPAHIRAALTQTQVCVPVEDNEPVFGQFQALYLFEHRRGPHQRELVLHMIGE